jgi:hypothetical protein
MRGFFLQPTPGSNLPIIVGYNLDAWEIASGLVTPAARIAAWHRLQMNNDNQQQVLLPALETRHRT